MLLFATITFSSLSLSLLLLHSKHTDANLIDRKTENDDVVDKQQQQQTNASPLLPQQIHLSLDGTDSHMVVTWSTLLLDPVEPATLVQLMSNTSAPRLYYGNASEFVDGGTLHSKQYIHSVTLIDLAPNFTYYYRVGSSKLLKEEIYSFKTMPFFVDGGENDSSSWQPYVMIYGDMGFSNLPIAKKVIEQGVSQPFDVVIHNGDIGYDLADDNGRVGDQFMNDVMEPLASRIPYMVGVGNHEHHYNFSHYVNRFRMPLWEETKNFYYSFDVGRTVHFVVINAECYYNLKYGTQQILNQYRWLEDDLRRTRLKNQQWIIVIGHRPLYCSTFNPIDCSPWGSLLRQGVRGGGDDIIPGIETLLYKYGVDLYFGAHEHMYERLWPVFDLNVLNGTKSPNNPYFDAGAPVHITSGSAGNHGRQSNFQLKSPKFTAFRTRDFGYSRLRAHNVTHLHVDFVSVGAPADSAGAANSAATRVIDDFWIAKSEPTPAWLSSDTLKNKLFKLANEKKQHRPGVLAEGDTSV